LFQAAVGLQSIGKYFSVLVAVFGTSVDDVQTGMVTRECGIGYGVRLSLDIQEHEGAVRWMKTIHIERFRGFGPARAVGKFFEVRVRCDKEELVVEFFVFE
jgi:hypothetical protein